MFTLGSTTFTWEVPPTRWAVADEALTAVAAAGTDLFRSPIGSFVKDDAARALTAAPDGDWQLLARLRLDGHADWDAGVLLVRGDDHTWAKLTLELAPDGTPSIYSVVTRDGRSDDAIGAPVDATTAWLRISSLDGGYAFHWSRDGGSWRLARQFVLAGAVRVGLGVQSPVGDGCQVVFDQVRLQPTRLRHLLDGS